MAPLKGVEHGSGEYRDRVKHMARIVFRAYEGGSLFLWLNRRPYREKERFDFFVAGPVFGALLRRQHGGSGKWSDLHLDWIETLLRASEDGAADFELDGKVVFPKRYVEKLLREMKGWL
jgi:hypothetical protein